MTHKDETKNYSWASFLCEVPRNCLDSHFVPNEEKQHIKTIYTLNVDFFTIHLKTLKEKRGKKALIVEAYRSSLSPILTCLEIKKNRCTFIFYMHKT